MSARRTAVLLLLLAACGEQAPAPAGGPTPSQAAPAGKPAPAVNPPTEADREAHDYPSLATRSGGDAWQADIGWDGKSDGLELGQVNKVEEVEALPHRVYASPTRLLFTASAVDAADALHVLFCEQTQDGWALRELVAPAAADGSADSSAPPRTLRAAAGRNCVEPALAADESGALLATWVEVAAAGLSLWAAALGPAGWSAPVEVSGQRASNWSPSVCATGKGSFAIAWDAAVDGDYDVQLARLTVGDGQPRVSSRQRVTDTPRFEAHASVTSSGKRLYVAYDVGPERWGREGSINKVDEALHSERTIEIVAVEGDQVAPIALQPTSGMADALARNCEQPRLMAEGKGALVLMFRGLPLPREIDDPDSPNFSAVTATRVGGVGWRTSIWITYMTRLDGAVWGFGQDHHAGIPESKGRCDSPGALTRRPKGGLVVAASGDGRDADALVETSSSGTEPDAKEPSKVAHTWWKPITKEPTRIVTRLLKAEPLVREIETGPWHALAAPRTPQPRAALPSRAGPGGPLQLALGDLHRHTDISRCSSNWDGPVSDALRYAFDVAPLDFLAITDHFDHMTKYDWWREVAQVDAWNAPGRMTDLRAYERADLSSGHRNVISGDGELPPLIGDRYGYDPARDSGRADTPAELWPLLAGHKVLTIPHTPAGMTPSKPEVLDWSSFNPAFDRDIEVFQSYRGSSEASGEPRTIKDLVPERYVRPNLDLGMQFGLVAGSDHQTSSGAFTGAWITGPTRDGVFDALFARRTFASSVRAALWTEWAGVPMGAAAPVPAAAPGDPPSFHVEVDGFGRKLKTIELISGGAVVAKHDETDGRSADSVDFPLDPPKQGSRYAYTRVTFADDEMMWSSPVRLYIAADWAGPDGPGGKELGARLGDVWKLTTDPLREKMRSIDKGY